MSKPISMLAFARLRLRSRLFAVSTSGLAALEFALVLPLMIVLYFGATEVTFMISADRKVTLLSRTLADLVGRATSLSNDAVDDVFVASKTVMAPHDTTGMQMVVSSVIVKATGATDGNGKPVVEGRVCWSKAKGTGATALSYNSVVPVPDGFKTPSTSFIRADVVLAYQPVFGEKVWEIVTPQDLRKRVHRSQTPWPVRSVQQVTLTADSKTPCPMS